MIALAAIVCFANWVEALAGFGSTLFALVLGAYFFPLEQLVPTLVPLNLLLSAYIVFRHPAGVDWKILGRQILPWAGAGTVVGVLVFGKIPQKELKLVFGAVVAGLALFELGRFRTEAKAAPLSGFAGAGWLLGGGLMQGLYASGGPMIVYFSSRSFTDKYRFRSTLSMLWLILNLAVFAGLALKGELTSQTLRLSAWMLAPVGLGIALGEWSHSRVPERAFRKLTYGLLFVAGISLLVRSGL